MSGNPSGRTFRRVAAVVAGFALVLALSTGTDAVMHAAGVFPPLGSPMPGALFLLALAYRVVFAAAGGYLAARLAPDRPVRHAVVLGFVGLAAGLAGAAATWNAGPEMGPRWYAIAVAATALPACWLGGKLAASRAAKTG